MLALLGSILRPSVLRLAALATGVMALSACGPSPNLVTVRVEGLVPNIKELFVTMQLDGTPARNSRPMAESGDSAFVVHDEMSRFGVEVPSSTGTLALDIKGYDNLRETVRSGAGSVSLGVSHELTITLTGP